MIKKFLLLGIVLIIVVLAPQVWATAGSLRFLASLLPPEPVPLGPGVVREVIPREGSARLFLFRPNKTGKKYPGIVLSMGIHPLGAEEPNLQKLFRVLVEQGFVVIAVDSHDLRNTLITAEEIRHLVDGFRFLSEHPFVDPRRIGFIGLSVGSSLAFLAAADLSIANNVHYILWLGGYYDAKELVIETLSRSFLDQGQLVTWTPGARIQEAVTNNLIAWAPHTEQGKERAAEILATGDRAALEALFKNLPAETIAAMEAISPKSVVRDVRAPLFVLHGRHDVYIPSAHSAQLGADFRGRKRLLLSLRYGHDAPQKPGMRDIFSGEFWNVVFIANELRALAQ